MRSRLALVSAGLAALVALAFVLGVLFAGGVERDPDPPCEEGEAPTADGGDCMGEDEACNAHGQSVRGQTVSCVARSDDGRGILRPLLAGQGRVDVTVRDGEGRILLPQAYSLARGPPGDVALAGAPGAWRLEVRFTEVQGDVRVVLYG